MELNHRSGAELQDAREIAGLTQQQIADALGVHRTTVVAWEGRARVKAPKAAAYLRAVRELADGKAA